MAMPLPKLTAKDHAHIHGLGTRLTLVALFSSLAVAGIAAGAALDIGNAVVADGRTSTERLVAVSQLVERTFIDAAHHVADEVGQTARVSTPASCNSDMAAVLLRDPRFVAVGVASADGAVTCGASVASAAIVDRNFLRHAAEAKTFVMGDYAIDPSSSRPTITFAEPVIGSDTASATAFVVMNAGALTDGGLQDALPKNAVFGVTDSRATLLLGSASRATVGKAVPENELVTEMLARKNGSAMLVGADGIRRLYAFTRVAGVGFPGAYVYVGVPTADAFAASSATAFRDIVIALLLLCVAIWAALTMGDILILRRIRRMVAGMRNVIVGEKDEPLPLGLGELDDLSGIFERITGRMKEAQEHTDEKVRTRTADLEFTKGMAELEKARTEALLASIGEGVIAVDKSGKVIFINHEAEKLTGRDAAELVGKLVSDAFVIQDENGKPLEEKRRPARIALDTGVRAVLAGLPKPCSLVRKDGSAFPVQVTVSPVSFGDRIIGAIEVIRDITDETEFDRRKSEFISIASHQLRSPLAAVKWLTDMLRKGDVGALQPKQQEMADKLFEANERMVVLVNELLDVQRIDSGVTKPTLKPTDLRVVLDGIVTDTTSILAEKKQKFVYAPGALPVVNLDPLLFREAVVNLISNASKYSPDGATVTVSAEQRGEDVVIGIKDSGIGIPQADQNQLFKKFFRAENALKSAVQGTGLGLYFSKSVVELSGGKIWFESVENKGTTFFVSLPLTTAAPASPSV